MTVTQDWSDLSLMGLFRLEVETQAAVISNHLIALEAQGQIDANGLDALMRAAHSIKGAARIVQVEAVVKIAHALEDFFMVAQQGKLQVDSNHVDVLLSASDFMLHLSSLEDAVLVEQSSSYESDTNKVVTAVEDLVSAALRDDAAADVSTESCGERAVSALSSDNHWIEDEDIAEETESQNIESQNIESQNEELQSKELQSKEPQSKEPQNKEFQNKEPENLEQQNLEPQNAESHASESHASESHLSRPSSEPAEAELSESTTYNEVAVELPQPAASLPAEKQKADRMVRINADNLNRLMGLAGESVVESNWLQPFAASLLQLKRQQQQVMARLETLTQAENRQQQLRQQQLRQKQTGHKQTGYKQNGYEQTGYKQDGYADFGVTADGAQSLLLSEVAAQMQSCQQLLNDRLSELDGFSQRFSQLSDRLYREMIASHMCAFEMGTKGYSRLVRDLAKTLGKQVKLTLEGLSTQVDRTLLEKLDAPIVHLITNAIAHGIEPAETRRAAGKPEIGTLRIEAVHYAGMLRIVVEDDGGGFDFAALRKKIVAKGMTPAEVVAQLSEPELIEFLFLPGFSTHSEVDRYSGRGYGLDIARSMVQSVGGSLLASSVPGEGTRFQFQLPLTLSVVRSLIFEVAGEPYALNLAHIGRVLRLSSNQIHYSENRPYFSLEAHQSSTAGAQTSENVSLVSASQLLAVSRTEAIDSVGEKDLCVIVLGEAGSRYGLCVERLRGEKDLVVRPLDPRLGKVPNISSAALSEKGEPILILDVADVLCSAANLTERAHAVVNTPSQSGASQSGAVSGAVSGASSGSSSGASSGASQSGYKREADKGRLHRTKAPQQKKVLVVDDSMTVRAMEKKLLQNRGYAVDMAVDGADGWNALRMNTYDLVVTDIDMPRLNGIELIEKIRSHRPTKKLPVIVVSYKDRQADQLAGLEAGANYYLTKSSFHNDGLINAVVDLIGTSAAPKTQRSSQVTGQNSASLIAGHSS